MSGCYIRTGEYLAIVVAVLADLGYSMSQIFFDTCNVTAMPSVPTANKNTRSVPCGSTYIGAGENDREVPLS